jgi:hypothetical protein
MAAGDPGSPARYYSSTAVETALGSSIPAQSQNQANTSFIVGSISGFPTDYPYTLIVDPDTSKEEVVTVYAGSGTTLSVYRGADNTQAVAHSAGAVVRHGVSGREFRESENHIAARGYDIDQTILNAANQTHVHGIATGDGVIVGTLKTQTLTNKTLTSPVITNPSISGAGVDASIVFEGATADAYETTLTVVDPTQDNTITLPNTTGTVVIATAVQTLTNKTIDMTGKTLTGLSSAGMVSSSATPKDYVDAFFGPLTSAVTSAASAAASAAAAATSATSAANSATASAASASASATSASAAATSATSAATSATAAATSATSASNSATAAATSATSAAASATAAATSATSAAASATTAAASVATIAGYATDSANSASAAATSAGSAANSATASANSASASATSASAAATSATSAATSATSAATSATAAATSATSAATSASSALTSQTAAATSASSALTSQTAAATSATSAENSATASQGYATAAATSAASAATSASSAATTYDNFDDRYLGSKSSPPTVDNDGNTLLVGAIYWNDVLNAMYVWSGSTWVQIATTSVYTAPTLGSTTIASGTTYATLTGLTLDGGLTTGNPSTALGIANKQYVDEVAEGLRVRPSVRAATTGNLSANYYNGPANNGVGATLTADTNRAFSSLDGVTSWSITTPPMGVLVKNQTNKAQNGRYNLTTLGSSSEPWVLTRCGLCDESDEIPGSYSFVQLGTVNEGTGWVQIVADPDTFVIGTDDINVYQFSGATYTAGTGLTLTGTTFSITDTAVTAGTYTAATITVNAQGQITSASTTAITTDPNPQIFMLMGA